MTDEQRNLLQEILNDTWYRNHSADDAFDMIEDLIFDIRDTAKREVE